MTKIRWSIKENSNYITAELQVLLTFILYFLQILGAYFYPKQKHYDSLNRTLVLSQSLWVTCRQI